MDSKEELRIAVIGAGTIGLSFAAFHLSHLPSASHLTIYDTRPNAEEYIRENLPKFFNDTTVPPSIAEVKIATTLQEAVTQKSIVQESGPENLQIKQDLWASVEKVHPYNPPHIMALLELVPSPETSAAVIERTQDFWRSRGKVPILIHKETTGFVANRLAFALLREAIHLVSTGVVSVAELDKIVESSMGPRWAVAGPFKSYHAGGGPAGLEGFFKNIGETVQACWSDAGRVNVGDGWEEKVFARAREVYGSVDVGERDRVTKRLLDVLEEEKGRSAATGILSKS